MKCDFKISLLQERTEDKKKVFQLAAGKRVKVILTVFLNHPKERFVFGVALELLRLVWLTNDGNL